jgi:hypothetical protein
MKLRRNINKKQALSALAIAAAMALLLAFLLAGCSALDVVGKTAIITFQALLDKTSGSVALEAATNRWVLTSPQGEKFEWSVDFSGQGPDFRLAFDATPYLQAGLDPTLLPAERYQFDPRERTLSLRFEVGAERFTYKGSPSPLDTFTRIVQKHRPLIGYHEALDHYGISLGDGNMLEWAKDMDKNDKDLVFVLNPKPLLQAGVDPARITGWVFTKVPVKHGKSKAVEVDMFLKPYNL